MEQQDEEKFYLLTTIYDLSWNLTPRSYTKLGQLFSYIERYKMEFSDDIDVINGLDILLVHLKELRIIMLKNFGNGHFGNRHFGNRHFGNGHFAITHKGRANLEELKNLKELQRLSNIR